MSQDTKTADAGAIEPSKPVIPDSEIDDHELSLLTDEERAALLDDDEEGESDESGESSEADGEDGATDDGEAPGEAPTAADEAPENRPERPEPIDVEPLNAKLADIEKKRDSLMEQFEDGDITREEYRANLSDLSKDERAVTKDIAKAEAVQEAIKTQFYSAVADYADRYPDLLDRDGPHIEAFDRHVRAVTASPAYQHLTYPKMLEAAHKLYAAEAEVLGGEFIPLAGAKPKPDAAPEPPAKPKRPEPPKTLARVPAAAPVAVSDGKFSQLQQRIDAAGSAEEIEAIMASLSPEDQEAFASADA